MKQYYQKLASKLDALSLRERVLVFAGMVLVLIFLLKAILLDPQFDRQKKLSLQIKQDQDKIAALQLEIQQKIQAQGLDPDKINQDKLELLRQQSAQLRSDMMGVQKNLVPPAKMPTLLEDILRRNGRLKLVSLKNLPLVSLDSVPNQESAPPATGKDAAKPTDPAAKAQSPAANGLIFRHGVEIVVRGNYSDMVNYLSALEAMPWEVYWGNARLSVDKYPVSTLTLTLYTLSLDKSWLNL